VTAQRARDGVQALVPLGGPKFSVSRSGEDVTHLDTVAAGLTGVFDTSVGKLTTTTSYSYWNLGPATNTLSFGFADLENDSALKQTVWSEELKLSRLVSDRLSWTAGVFASDTKTNGAFTRAFSGFVFEESAYRIKQGSLAAFGEANITIGPSFTLTPGLRVEGSDKKLDRAEIVPSPGNYNRKETSTAILPKLVGSYRIDAETEISLSGVSGYKPGGFSAFTGNRALTRFGPERLAGVEAAVTRSSGKLWSATLRGYSYWVDGYQIERSFQTGGIADDYLVVNAARARSIGGELEVQFTPIDVLTIGVDLGISQVTLQDFRDPFTAAIYDGNRAPYVPSYDASVRVEYRPATGWFVRAEASLVGKTFYTEAEDPMFAQSSYALLSGRVGYSLGRYSIAAFGENLTDKEYYSSITPGTFHGTPGAPRTYGVEVSARF
jgi:outer membrane receptor protein involved in Fe transport